MEKRAGKAELRKSISTIEYILDKSTIRPNGSTTIYASGGHQAVIQIIELKNKIREGKSDPIMQAKRGYTSIFCSAQVGPSPFHNIILLRDHV